MDSSKLESKSGILIKDELYNYDTDNTLCRIIVSTLLDTPKMLYLMANCARSIKMFSLYVTLEAGKKEARPQIEQGLKSQDMAQEQIDKILSDINNT